MLNELRDEIYSDAVAHGLWDEANRLDDEGKRFACGLAIWDEAQELELEFEHPERFTEELADVIITALSAAGYLGIDIDAEVRKKMEINRERPWRHGK